MTDLPAPRHRYATVTWRGLTRACERCSTALLSLDLVDLPEGGRADLIAQLQAGEPLRLLVSEKAAADLIDVLTHNRSAGYGLCPACRSQSASSAGSPMADVSMLPGVGNV